MPGTRVPIHMKKVVIRGKLLDIVITHTFPLESIKNAWELQLTRQCGKVLLYPWA